MPRDKRKQSESGIYHIILRGVNRQTIFIDNEDITRLLYTIKKYKELCQYEVYGYCIMDNHIHLLIKEVKESISDSLKRIIGSYVFWYNRKYERCGHLFQERFKSEAVDSDEYFLTVLRYIHQNPVKAGITEDISKYKWSSYHDYIGEADLVDIDFALDMFSVDRKNAVKSFVKFNYERRNDVCLDYEERISIPDSKIIECLAEQGIMNISEFKNMDKYKRNETIKNLKSIEGVTVRQLSRITGISKSLINRI